MFVRSFQEGVRGGLPRPDPDPIVLLSEASGVPGLLDILLPGLWLLLLVGRR